MISLLGPCWAPLKFLNKLSGFELSCIIVSQPVGLTTGQHSSGIPPESAGRLVVFVYLIACTVTL